MAKSKIPYGWRWVTIHRNGQTQKRLIRDKGSDFSIDPNTGDYLDNKAEKNDPEKFVTDTEMYEAREDKERQINEAKKEAERLNKEQKFQDIEKQRKSINRKINNAENRIKYLETQQEDPYLSLYLQEKFIREINQKKEVIRKLKQQLEGLG